MRAWLLLGKALKVLYFRHKGLSLENNLHKGSKPGQNRNCRNTERSENRMLKVVKGYTDWSGSVKVCWHVQDASGYILDTFSLKRDAVAWLEKYNKNNP